MVEGRVGSERGARTWALAPARGRRRCFCCGKKVTHIGLGDGVALIDGCEWRVRLWVRNPDSVRRKVPRSAPVNKSEDKRG